MSKTEAEFKPISTDPESSQTKGFEALRMSFFMGCWQGTTSYLKEDLNSLLKSILDTKLSMYLSSVPEAPSLAHVL